MVPCVPSASPEAPQEGTENNGACKLGCHISLSRVQPAQRSQRKSLLKELSAAASKHRLVLPAMDRLQVHTLLPPLTFRCRHGSYERAHYHHILCWISSRIFMTCLTPLQVLVNDTGTRTFITVGPSTGDLPLLGLIRAFDVVLTRHHLQPFYSPPRVHISLAWLEGNTRSTLETQLAGLQQRWQESVGPWHVKV
jgi:Uncharacterised conserved protein